MPRRLWARQIQKIFNLYQPLFNHQLGTHQENGTFSQGVGHWTTPIDHPRRKILFRVWYKLQSVGNSPTHINHFFNHLQPLFNQKITMEFGTNSSSVGPTPTHINQSQPELKMRTHLTISLWILSLFAKRK
jgi:hypothetical protein